MQPQDPQPLFRALADPTRRAILTLLRQEPMSIAELAANFDMTRAAVKKHLLILAEAELISFQRQGRQRLCHLTAEALHPAARWITTFEDYWTEPLTKLTALAEGIDTQGDTEDKNDLHR